MLYPDSNSRIEYKLTSIDVEYAEDRSPVMRAKYAFCVDIELMYSPNVEGCWNMRYS
jgi:hypothetical protein